MEFLCHGNKIHYEVYGEGKPLLILNGIMMSTASWKIFIEPFSKSNKLILMDFLDQGQSERMVGKPQYTHKEQVEVVRSLIVDELKLSKVNIAGISYGGEVAIQFAEKYPELLDRLVLSNTAAKTYPLLKDFGDAWNLAGENENPGRQYYFTSIPVVYSPYFYEKRLDWMRNREKTLIPFMNQKEVMATFKRLVISSEDFDCLKDLNKITAKTLIISCENDILIPPMYQRILHENIKDSDLVLIPNIGHCSMYESPYLWASLVLGFVNIDNDIILP